MGREIRVARENISPLGARYIRKGGKKIRAGPRVHPEKCEDQFGRFKKGFVA